MRRYKEWGATQNEALQRMGCYKEWRCYKE